MALAGGSWQAFMAWVPNAAAMQIAEPWKPLPQNEAAGKQRQVMKQKKEGGSTAVSGGSMLKHACASIRWPAGGELSILPGVPDDKTKVWRVEGFLGVANGEFLFHITLCHLLVQYYFTIYSIHT